ncbi:MAG: alcohol dehydrogenase catalytic domain-containing protein [Clostridiaceae bacterium]|nr:alcohol dehydrogenase catalytic domain-containing protein [Clostridiaceae bacterium]
MSLPKIDSNESLIKIVLAGICNTDREIIKGYKPGFQGVLGHEFVGEVVKSSNPSLIGQRVVGELNKGCGQCFYCKRQLSRHCLDRKIIGMSIDGCFAEYMAISTDLLHIIPKNLSNEKALFTEPLAAAISIIDTGHIKPTDHIAIVGDGRLAFMIAQVLALSGSNLTIVGRHQTKLDQFRSFAKTALEAECPTPQQFDIVIEATGSPSGMKNAMKLVRSFGEIIVKSTYEEALTLDFSEIVVREIKVRGSRCGPFEPALKLLAGNFIKFPKIDLFELHDYKRAFASKAFKSGFIISD